jgi:hypothetical protein
VSVLYFVDAPGERAQPSCRAGSELKRLLAGWPFRITPDSGCQCNAMAASMDARGCDWCEQNTDEIVGWLRREAGRRGIPFLDAAGKILVRLAIRNARRNLPR